MTTQLWSLWDMLILNARNFANLIFRLTEAETAMKASGASLLSDGVKGTLSDLSISIAEYCKQLEIPVSAGAAEQLASATTAADVLFAIPHLRNTVFTELKSRNFYGPLIRYADYFEKSELFGDDVFRAFPSANEDITEAGTCLALERATACVMHLNRANEVALKALANTVGVGPQNDWGGYIREIDKELEKRKRTAGARTAAEQFYADACIQFDNMKRAWRNPTMHPEKTYSPQRAEEILMAVKSFMSHLATKISE